MEWLLKGNIGSRFLGDRSKALRHTEAGTDLAYGLT